VIRGTAPTTWETRLALERKKPSQTTLRREGQIQFDSKTMSSSSSARGWLEGTLDVISGMAPSQQRMSGNSVHSAHGSGAPTQHNSSYASAPNSPMRSVHSAYLDTSTDNEYTNGGFPEILRLPSQDSVDISIHNDSGHGKKSTAQMIKDLRQSNARLTARTAALEADFMNQLNQATKQFEDQKSHLQQIAREQSQSLQKAETRAKSDKAKLKDQEETLQRLKEESAFQRHSISDLKSQLRSMGGGGDGGSVSGNSIHVMEESFVDHGASSQQHEEQQALLQQKLQQMEQTMREMQLQHDEELNQMALQLQQEKQQQDNNAGSSSTDSGPLSLQQHKKDAATIAELRQKVLDYSQELTQAQTELSSVKHHAETQERYRQEEAEDLRVLNDAQDEEIGTLRQQLENVEAELEATAAELQETKQVAEELEQELQTVTETLKSNDNDNSHKQEKSNSLSDKETLALQRQFETSQETLQEMKQAWQEERTEHKQVVSDLKGALRQAQQAHMEEKDDWVQERNELEMDLQEVQGHVQTLNAQTLTLQTELQQARAVQEVPQDEIHHNHDENAQIKEQMQQQLVTIENLTQEKQDLQQQLKRAQQDAASQKTQDEALLKRRWESEAQRRLEAQKEVLQRELETSYHDKIQNAEEEVQNLQHDKETWQAQHDNMQTDLDQALKKVQTLEQENSRLKQQVRTLKIKSPRSLKSLGSSGSSDQSSPSALTQSQNLLQKQLSPTRGGASPNSNSVAASPSGSSTHSSPPASPAAMVEMTKLRNQLQQLSREKQQEVEELSEKLQDRDTTISALVKSSVSMEQQIASLQIEMDLCQAKLAKARSDGNMTMGEGEEGVDVILAKGEDLGKLKSSLDAYKETETRLSNEVFRLKRQLHHAKLENGRLRQDLVQNKSLSSPSSTGSNHSGNNVEHGLDNSSVPPQQLKERDEAIARLVKQSMTQDETISDLRKQVEVLQSKKSRNSSGSRSATQDEIDQLRQETEMFAGQVIEQDEEIESLQKRLSEKTSLLADAERDVENYKRAAEAVKKRAQQQQQFEEEKYVAELEEYKNKLIPELEDRILGLTEELHQAQDELDAKTKQAEAAAAEAMQQQQQHNTPPIVANVDMGRIHELEDEVDELREAKKEQLQELRVLRRQVHDADASSDQLERAQREMLQAKETSDRLAAQVQELQQEVDDLLQYKNNADSQGADNNGVTEQDRILDLQHEIVERDRIIGELKQNVMMSSTSRSSTLEPEEDIPADEGSGMGERENQSPPSGVLPDEVEVENLREEIDRLRNNLNSQSAALENARGTIRELESMSAERAEEEHARFEEEKEEMMAEVEELTQQLDAAQAKIEELRKDELIIDEFKYKLEQADEDRELAERTIVDNYERKLSLLTLDKDVTFDKLRKDLQAEKEKSAKDREEAETTIGTLESQLHELKEQAQKEIDERDNHIMSLEQTLSASKQLIENMRTEMDHLQGSMVHATAGRREEIEDMQQELVDVTATAARQERDIEALRQQLEDKQVAHDSQVGKLQETIELLESQIGSSTQQAADNRRNAQDLAMELKVKEIKDRLEKLKWRNNSLAEENGLLRDRLEKVGAGESVVQAEKQKIAQLQLKIAEQSKRIQTLEAKLSQARQEAAEATEAAAKAAMPPPSLPPTHPATVTPEPQPQQSGKQRPNTSRQSSRGFFGRRSKSDASA